MRVVWLGLFVSAVASLLSVQPLRLLPLCQLKSVLPSRFVISVSLAVPSDVIT